MINTEIAAARYWKLLRSVESKFPGETRHQTALRYIQQAEMPVPGNCTMKECPEGMTLIINEVPESFTTAWEEANNGDLEELGEGWE